MKPTPSPTRWGPTGGATTKAKPGQAPFDSSPDGMLTFRLASHPPKRFSLFEVSQREGDFEAAGAQLHQLLRCVGQPVLTLQHGVEVRLELPVAGTVQQRCACGSTEERSFFRRS